MSDLAILGGPKTRTEPYPEWPVWDQRDIDAVTEVIKSGRWGGYPYPGPKTAELAKKFAEMQGVLQFHGKRLRGERSTLIEYK